MFVENRAHVSKVAGNEERPSVISAKIAAFFDRLLISVLLLNLFHKLQQLLRFLPENMVTDRRRL